MTCQILHGLGACLARAGIVSMFFEFFEERIIRLLLFFSKLKDNVQGIKDSLLSAEEDFAAEVEGEEVVEVEVEVVEVNGTDFL